MSTGKNIFMARQPIFDKNKEIFGYELLFRSGMQNFFDLNTDMDYASSRTISDSFLNFNVKEITGGRKAFMNFTESVLLNEIAFMLPKDILVVELLETVEPSPAIEEAFKKLKQEGYSLALDDFEFEDKYKALIELSDIIKIDFMNTSIMERKRIIKKINSPDKLFLAEKVETHEEFKSALDMGYSYFQGYFFQKPVIVSTKEIKGYKLNILELMKAIEDCETDFSKVEAIVKRDVALTYKLLRFINSASLGVVRTVTSISHAINLIGLAEFRKWVTMMLMIRLGEDKPEALMRHSIVRATFCESISSLLKGNSWQPSDYFLIGLFSLIDAYLDRPMEELVKELPIEAHLKAALTGEGNSLRQALEIFESIEQSNWELFTELCSSCGVNEEVVGSVYIESLVKGETYY